MFRTAPIRPQRGFTLVELLVGAVLIATLTLILVPPLLSASAKLRLRLAAAEVATTLYRARSEAIRLRHNVGLRFDRDDDGRVTFTLYRDTDGDGLRNADIRRGIDGPLAPPRRLDLGRGIRFGFPRPAPRRDPSGRRLVRLGDPVRFNRSDLASFSPLGTSTPGSVYLTDSRGILVAVRLLGRTGKVRIVTWDPETDTWH